MFLRLCWCDVQDKVFSAGSCPWHSCIGMLIKIGFMRTHQHSSDCCSEHSASQHQGTTGKLDCQHKGDAVQLLLTTKAACKQQCTHSQDNWVGLAVRVPPRFSSSSQRYCNSWSNSNISRKFAQTFNSFGIYRGDAALVYCIASATWEVSYCILADTVQT